MEAAVAIEMTRSNAEITAFHEAYPGHHVQIGLAHERQSHPITRLVGNSGFIEGWARYAEALAATDPRTFTFINDHRTFLTVVQDYRRSRVGYLSVVRIDGGAKRIEVM